MKSLFAITAFIAVSFLAPTPAAATVITSILDFDFSGNQGITGSATVTFDDQNTPGTVKLTVDLTNLNAGTGTEFLSDLWFNFNGDPNLLVFGAFTGTGPAPNVSTCLGAEGAGNGDCTITDTLFKPDGAGFFDVWFEWGTSNSDATRFDTGESIMTTIALAGITANDFSLLSTPSNNGQWCVAAHAQGFVAGDGSDFLGGTCSVGPPPPPPPPSGVPEPGTLALLGAALSGLGWARSRRKRSR